MLTKQSEMQSQVILISSLNKGVLNSYIPVIVFYLTCQKHIIAGVAAGAVKG